MPRTPCDTLGAMTDFELVFEFSVEDDTRAQVGAMFPAHWITADEVARRGWVQREPLLRLLARHESALVGQAAIAELKSGVPRVLAIGDVVVAEAARGHGTGSELLRRAVAGCEEAGTDLILTASRNLTVRKAFRALGFTTPRRESIFFRRGDLWCWNETWLARGLFPSDPIELGSDF